MYWKYVYQIHSIFWSWKVKLSSKYFNEASFGSSLQQALANFLLNLSLGTDHTQV